jgi:hypothetical protein
MLIVLALIAASILFTGSIDPLTIGLMLIPVAAYYLTEEDRAPQADQAEADRTADSP